MTLFFKLVLLSTRRMFGTNKRNELFEKVYPRANSGSIVTKTIDLRQTVLCNIHVHQVQNFYKQKEVRL